MRGATAIRSHYFQLRQKLSENIAFTTDTNVFAKSILLVDRNMVNGVNGCDYTQFSNNSLPLNFSPSAYVQQLIVYAYARASIVE